MKLLKEFARQAGGERLLVLDDAKLPELSDCNKAGAIGEAVELLDGYYRAG